MTNLMDPSRPRKSLFDRIFDAFAVVMSPLMGVRWNLELFTVIYPVEAIQRLWYHLDRRIYREAWRLRRVSDGQPEKPGKKFLLFVLYARNAIPPFTRTLLEAAARSDINLVISTNATMSPALRTELLGFCQLLVERADLGRDFGGYKDGISIIERRFGRPERLILLNDSLYYFDRDLDGFLEKLSGPDDLICMTEVFEYHYHLGSFALSFGPAVLGSARFRRYWQRYLPISTRRWAIHKGEVGLTRMLIRAGFRPRVLYHAAQLIPHLDHQETRAFLESIRLLPREFRERLFSEFEEVHVAQTDRSLQAIGTLSKAIRRIEAGTDPASRDLKLANVRELLEMNHLTATTQLDRETWVLRTLRHRLVSAISRRNQMHAGGFLFMRLLGMPAIKRDICFRELFQVAEVEEFLDQLGEPMREVVASDLRQKGSQAYLSGFARLLAKHGSI